MLHDSKLPTTFWAEAVSTAFYVQNRVLVVKPYNKTPYELFRGFKPALTFMRPFGCHVTILNTSNSLGKFDGKSDEVIAATITNDSAGTSEEISQDCIVMPIWKDTSYFDSPTKDVDNGEPKTIALKTCSKWELVMKSAFLYGTIEEEVYVDDIIFGSTNKELCTRFEKLMKDNQDKYVDEILKKFNYTNVKSTSTPVDLEKPLVKDRDGNDVDEYLYRSMIGSLMYLTTSRPDIMFVVGACARFQVTPKTSHSLSCKENF
ncbi:hypothetical protein Tco_0540621 [Tanacetum coccineum]